jgi:hypothetical protein
MYNRLPGMLGLRYIGLVLRELLTSDAKGGAAVRLDDDLKASIIDVMGQMMKSTSRSMVVDWSSVFINNGLDASFSYLIPYTFTVSSQQDYPFARCHGVAHCDKLLTTGKQQTSDGQNKLSTAPSEFK